MAFLYVGEAKRLQRGKITCRKLLAGSEQYSEKKFEWLDLYDIYLRKISFMKLKLSLYIQLLLCEKSLFSFSLKFDPVKQIELKIQVLL